MNPVQENRRPFPRPSHIVGASFLLLFLFSGAGYYSFSIFIWPLEREFGWSRASIALTMSIHFIVAGFFGPLLGRLVQVHGPRKVMILGALGAGAFFMLVSLTHSLWFLYVTYGLLAICISAIGIIPVSSLLARWFSRNRGTATGVAMMGISVGGLVLAPSVGLITTHFGWKASFIFLGILVWALALPLAIGILRDSPDGGGAASGEKGMTLIRGSEAAHEDPGAFSAGSQEGLPLRAVMRKRAFGWTGATFFFAAFAQSGILQHQVPMLSEVGLPSTVAATALGLTAGLGAFGKLSFGRLSDLLPFRYGAALCFALQGLAVLILLLAQSQVMIWIYILIFGVAMGGIVVLLPVAVGHFFGLASFGVILGMVNFSQALGGSVGAFFSGWIHDQMGNYTAALVAFLGAYFLAILAIFMAGKPEPRDE